MPIIDPDATPPSNRTVAGGMLIALAIGLFIDGAMLLYAGRPHRALDVAQYSPGVMLLVLALLLAVVGTGAVIDERRA